MGRGKIKTTSEIVRITKTWKDLGRKIVTTNGVFDILHPGHIFILERAKQLGDILIVGLNSDDSVRSYKPGRPINNQEDRARVISSLETVDYVVIFEEPDPRNLISIIQPDFHVKSREGYKGLEEEVIGEGKIYLINDLPGYSTSDIIQRAFRSEYSKLVREI